MPTVEELLSHKELVDYTKTRTPQQKVLAEVFPERKTEALEIKMIKGANNLPVSASIHAFDTEAEIDQREGTGYDVAELALIKRKRKLSEKEIIRLETPRNCRKIKLPFILTNYNISITIFLSHSGG